MLDDWSIGGLAASFASDIEKDLRLRREALLDAYMEDFVRTLAANDPDAPVIAKLVRQRILQRWRNLP